MVCALELRIDVSGKRDSQYADDAVITRPAAWRHVGRPLQFDVVRFITFDLRRDQVAVAILVCLYIKKITDADIYYPEWIDAIPLILQLSLARGQDPWKMFLSAVRKRRS